MLFINISVYHPPMSSSLFYMDYTLHTSAHSLALYLKPMRSLSINKPWKLLLLLMMIINVFHLQSICDVLWLVLLLSRSSSIYPSISFLPTNWQSLCAHRDGSTVIVMYAGQQQRKYVTLNEKKTFARQFVENFRKDMEKIRFLFPLLMKYWWCKHIIVLLLLLFSFTFGAVDWFTFSHSLAQAT